VTERVTHQFGEVVNNRFVHVKCGLVFDKNKERRCWSSWDSDITCPDCLGSEAEP